VGSKWNYVCTLVDLSNREVIGYSAGPNLVVNVDQLLLEIFFIIFSRHDFLLLIFIIPCSEKNCPIYCSLSIDILNRRDSFTLKNHFIANYDRQTLNNVKTVTIDMNAGYVSVIKEVFPQAQIIIDRFHIVQLVSRSMNMTRVGVMNGFRTSNGEDMKKYRRLKRYWRLILKRRKELSYTEYKFYMMF